MGPEWVRVRREDLERETARLLGRLAEIEWLAGLFPILARRGQPITLMFTDLEGFTAYAASRGDRAAVRLLRRHDEAVLPAIKQYRGRILKRLGDGLMVAFPSPSDAVKAALAMQQAARQLRLKLRIGIHAGQARSREGDLIGHDVNIASRIADRAQGGEILVSAAVREASDGVEARFRRARALVIEGRKPIPLFRVGTRA
jgi:adenylate cyclase